MDIRIASRHFALHQNILRELGHELEPGCRVLDFGCGPGNMVQQYLASGCDAYGCDPRLETETERLRRIDARNGLLPFPDDTFDFVFSDQVMEHVQDHSVAFAEIARVLKPGGSSLHIFPAKWKPVENHIYVPLGGAIKSRWWLSFWATLGIRNGFQRGKAPAEVLALNSKYLREQTNYLTRADIIKTVSRYFDTFVFAEAHMIKHSYGNARRIYPLVRIFPFVARLYSDFYSRVIFLKKHDR
jgi:SAM-dependent methyltransferase